MSSLNDQLNSFKNKVRHAPTIQRRVVNNTQESSNTTTTPTSPNKRKAADTTTTSTTSSTENKKKKPNFTYSQPSETGIGTHYSTQMVHALERIKTRDGPMPIIDIADYMSMPVDSLLPMLKAMHRIEVNEEKMTVEYVSIYNIYSAEDLMAYLQAQKTFQGIPVKSLKDGWNGCLAAIEKLEKEQKIVVWRTKKDNTPRYVWANTGGSIGGIDSAFTELWAKAKVPPTSDLPGELEKLGLKPTSVDPATIKKAPKAGDQRKQKKPRRGKITNTHMRGILKDYGV